MHLCDPGHGPTWSWKPTPVESLPVDSQQTTHTSVQNKPRPTHKPPIPHFVRNELQHSLTSFVQAGCFNDFYLLCRVTEASVSLHKTCFPSIGFGVGRATFRRGAGGTRGRRGGEAVRGFNCPCGARAVNPPLEFT